MAGIGVRSLARVRRSLSAPVGGCLAAALLSAWAGPGVAAQVVRGVVVDSSGAPVPFAIVAIADAGRTTLSDERGQFLFLDLTTSRHRVRVRQIGFRPAEAEVTARDPGSAVRDTVRLDRLAITLDTVSVGPAAECRQTGFAAATGGGVAELFEQLSLNTQRWMLIKAAGPDSIRYRRTRSFLAPDGSVLGERTDTVAEPSRRREVYVPGSMLRQEPDRELVLVIPSVDDLGDARFLNSHCFRYVAQEPLEGRTGHRIDFRPSDDITGTDVRGSVWLDVQSMELLKLEFHITGMDAPPRGAGEYKPVVTTIFATSRDGAPRQAQVVISKQVRNGRYQGKAIGRSEERQQLLGGF